MSKIKLKGQFIIDHKKNELKNFSTIKPSKEDSASFSLVQLASEEFKERFLKPSSSSQSVEFVGDINYVSSKSSQDTTVYVDCFSKGMPLDFVRKHLEKLKTINPSNAKPFLSNDDFEFFLNVAFLQNKKIEEKDKLILNTSGGNKNEIKYIFNDFYNAAVQTYDHHNPKKKYEDLLIDYFKGFTESNVRNNLKSRPVKSKYKL